MPFKNASAQESAGAEPSSAASSRNRPPEAFRDPSEHILSGKGSTLQHARSVYSQGPVQVLPGLFLGDEHNARDTDTLSALGITTILNVAKETVLDFDSQPGPSSIYPSAPRATWSNSATNLARPNPDARSAVNASAQHLTSIANQHEPLTPNTYFTPPATATLSKPQDHREASSPRDAISVSVLRNTSSTPNLLTHFLNSEAADPSSFLPKQGTEAQSISTTDLRTLTAQDVLHYRSLRRTSDSSSDDAFDTASSPSSSRAASTCTSTATELTPPALQHVKTDTDASGQPNATSCYAFENESQGSPCAWYTKVELPSNATAITVSASIGDGPERHEMRYVKLPWTHDETDLAAGRGGFAQGIALIAEALGIDDRYWYAAKIAEDQEACAALQDDSVSLQHILTHPSPGKILVHCQCGVSRSATLVIAFVMQAAAMRYGFETARGLLGMHDCYNMVKEKSASISPNISLIYQLVEWERYLSSAAGRLRDVLGMANTGSEGDAGGGSPADGQTTLVAPGWSTEPMDEAMWSKMRLEEEEKEAAEEAKRREERLTEAMRLAAERRAAQDRLEGRVPDIAIDAPEAGVGSLMQRRRKTRAPPLQLQTSATPAAMGAPTAIPPAPSPGLQRRRPPALQLDAAKRAGADNSGCSEVETPFQTARMEAWTAHEHDVDGDVTMADSLEPPQTPPRSSAADSDVVSTPTARSTSAVYGSESASCTLRTPNASSAWNSSAKLTGAAEPDEPTEAMQLSSTSSMSSTELRVATRRGSVQGGVPTTSLSQSSPSLPPAMSWSHSMGSRPNRFSFGGAPLGGSLAARLGSDSEPSSRSRTRPDSMQSTLSSSSSSTALFGVAALSHEERKKQHRRTFSSDWPTLRANLASQRRKSKVDILLVPPAIGDSDSLS